jgi:hypothetical protein
MGGHFGFHVPPLLTAVMCLTGTSGSHHKWSEQRAQFSPRSQPVRERLYSTWSKHFRASAVEMKMDRDCQLYAWVTREKATYMTSDGTYL